MEMPDSYLLRASSSSGAPFPGLAGCRPNTWESWRRLLPFPHPICTVFLPPLSHLLCPLLSLPLLCFLPAPAQPAPPQQPPTHPLFPPFPSKVLFLLGIQGAGKPKQATFPPAECPLAALAQPHSHLEVLGSGDAPALILILILIPCSPCTADTRAAL